MNPLGFMLAVAMLAVAYTAVTSWRVRQLALRRLYEDRDAMRGVVAAEAVSDGRLARWLSRAGYRAANAPGVFIGMTAGSAAVGLVAGAIYRLTLLRPLVDMVANAPGSTGDVLAAILQGGPWILFVVAALAPTIGVRRARRLRLRGIEQDLPLVLELFATMAEAGLLLYKNYLEVYVLKQQFDVKTMRQPTEDQIGASVCSRAEGRAAFPAVAEKYCPELIGKK